MTNENVAVASDDVAVSATPEIVNASGVASTKASEARESARSVRFATIKYDRNRNPRKESAYSDARTIRLARSIKANGLQDPFVLSERNDGSLWLLKGHRRHAAVVMLQTTGIPAGKNAKEEPEIAGDANFGKEVKCRVLKGLSIEAELDILMDHTEVVALDDQEKLLTAKILTRAGFTHDFIAAKLGESRSNYTNGKAKILAMPECVETAWLSEEKNAKRPTQPTLKLLHDAYKADRDAKQCGLREVGPRFAAAWEKFLNDPTPTPSKMIPREKLEAQIGQIADKDLRAAFVAVLDNKPNDLGEFLGILADRLASN